ncbi:MAG: hypothetical protein AAFP90_05085 [Planctomycetota bacterium]
MIDVVLVESEIPYTGPGTDELTPENQEAFRERVESILRRGGDNVSVASWSEVKQLETPVRRRLAVYLPTKYSLAEGRPPNDELQRLLDAKQKGRIDEVMVVLWEDNPLVALEILSWGVFYVVAYENLSREVVEKETVFSRLIREQLTRISTGIHQHRIPDAHRLKTVFVSMGYSDHDPHALENMCYRLAIQPALSHKGVDAVLSASCNHGQGGTLDENIREQIGDCDGVIFQLTKVTDWVLYELGVADMLNHGRSERQFLVFLERGKHDDPLGLVSQRLRTPYYNLTDLAMCMYFSFGESCDESMGQAC